MFLGLTERLTKVFDKLTGRGLISAAALDETAREIRIALLEADVALPVVKEFIAHIKEKALGQEVIKSVQPAQMVVKIVHDELVALLGESVPLRGNPYQTNIVMMVGLQGSGKTTTAAKIALKMKKDAKKVLLASLDTYRPAAQEQLAELGQKNGLDTLPIVMGEKPLEIAKRALQAATAGKYDYLIWDTAGRLAIDAEMMQELTDLQKLSQPAETLLVLDTLMGQDALNVATAFQEKIALTGLVLTRVDGDARGGVALSVRRLTGLPVQYMGVGEKVEALEAFDAKRIADRILGMGDVVGLVETAMEKVNQEDMAEQAMRMMQGQFTLEDLLAQLKQMDNLGDVKGIMKMIPGVARFAKQIDESQVDNRLIRRQQAIILSMTPRERKHPEILKAARKLRIAAGAGVKVEDVNRLLKSYEQMADVMKKFKKMGPFGMMSMMKKMGVNPESLLNSGGFPPFKV
ncbi:MAG: signal recognition particle protein [Alphaproteobacteria bacterium]